MGGPHITITGYRVPGTQAWTDINTATSSTDNGKPVHTRAAAFIPSTSQHLQVRLDVAGHRRVATR